MTGEFVVSNDDYADLDGMSIEPPGICLVGSELARKLIGRDFSEISVTAKPDELVWITVRFAAVVEPDVDGGRDDIATLRAMMGRV